MMKPLRKRHLQIWSFYALLIPAIIVSAYMAIPEKRYSGLASRQKATALPGLVSKKEGKGFSACIRRSADAKSYQLEWISPDGVEQPSALLYQVIENEQRLVGRIGAAGTYYFTLGAAPSDRFQFILYDIIHHRVTDSIKF